MTIYLDISAAVHAKAGLSRYARNMARALRPLLGERLRLFQNSLGHRPPLEGWDASEIVGTPLGYRPWRAAVFLRQVVRWGMDARLPDGELFHATEHLLPSLRRIPTVLTVHDLIYERFPAYHKVANYLYLKAAMPLYCRRATAIIAVSQATKADLQRYYDLPENKIHVIPEAPAEHFHPPGEEEIQRARDRYDLPGRYVLALGTIEPRKNLQRLVEACGPLIDEGILDGVVLVGSKGWLYDDFFDFLERCPWRQQVLLPGYVREQDLSAIYGAALVTAQPSLYEGFGLPVLEAMACGCPVCASSGGSLPEVGGDVAAYFDPLDVEEMRHTLAEVIEDEERRRVMRRAGLERVGGYSWRLTAQRTLELYEETLARS